MKKLLSIIFAMCLLLSMMTIGVSAEQQVSEGNASSTITYREQSMYCILIPETIDMNENSYTFAAEFINITDDEKIFVTVANADENGRILFTHESGNYTLKKDIITTPSHGNTTMPTLPTNCVGYFCGDDKTSKISFGLGYDCYEYERIRAGMYFATVEFSVNLGY